MASHCFALPSLHSDRVTGSPELQAQTLLSPSRRRRCPNRARAASFQPHRPWSGLLSSQLLRVFPQGAPLRPRLHLNLAAITSRQPSSYQHVKLPQSTKDNAEKTLFFQQNFTVLPSTGQIPSGFVLTNNAHKRCCFEHASQQTRRPWTAARQGGLPQCTASVTLGALTSYMGSSEDHPKKPSENDKGKDFCSNLHETDVCIQPLTSSRPAQSCTTTSNQACSVISCSQGAADARLVVDFSVKITFQLRQRCWLEHASQQTRRPWTAGRQGGFPQCTDSVTHGALTAYMAS
ncbi:hypothetical protein AAHC03_021024 [Spirometra sp. Aus1]